MDIWKLRECLEDEKRKNTGIQNIAKVYGLIGKSCDFLPEN